MKRTLLTLFIWFTLSMFPWVNQQHTNLYSQENKMTDDEPPSQIQWPIKGKKGKKLSSTFGESRYDHFHNGLDIPIHGVAVNPIQEAKVLWIRNPKRRLNETPFGGGNSVILEHNNSWSGYMHLQKIDSKILFQERLSVNDQIGYSGKTGHSGGSHLHFFVFDVKKSRFYNPLMLVDKTIIRDKKPPKLKHYRVTSSQTKKDELIRQNIPGNTLLAKIEDRGTGSEKWGIYYLKVFNAQGTLIKDMKFNYIQFLNHHWVNSNQKRFNEIYYGNRYILNQFANKTIKWEAGGLYGPSLTKRR